MANLRARGRCWGVPQGSGLGIPFFFVHRWLTIATKGFVLSKRVLMLTAATAALLSSPVMAQDFTDITTKVTEQIKTSTAADGVPGDILIESTGSVVVAVA